MRGGRLAKWRGRDVLMELFLWVLGVEMSIDDLVCGMAAVHGCISRSALLG